jgi:hypothetical protein
LIRLTTGGPVTSTGPLLFLAAFAVAAFRSLVYNSATLPRPIIVAETFPACGF